MIDMKELVREIYELGSAMVELSTPFVDKTQLVGNRIGRVEEHPRHIEILFENDDIYVINKESITSVEYLEGQVIIRYINGHIRLIKE